MVPPHSGDAQSIFVSPGGPDRPELLLAVVTPAGEEYSRRLSLPDRTGKDGRVVASDFQLETGIRPSPPFPGDRPPFRKNSRGKGAQQGRNGLSTITGPVAPEGAQAEEGVKDQRACEKCPPP